MSDDVLSHSGVPGMKWGKRKAQPTSSGGGGGGGGKFFNNPSATKAILLNSYGKKSAYTDPAALAKRKKAGKLRMAAMLTSLGGNLAGNVVAKTNPVAGQAIQSLLGTAAGGLQIGATINGAMGAHEESLARKRG
jgi:hypothetical protein